MTEFHQPIHPMRITLTSNGDWFHVPVFAIAISNSHDIEYLTVYGQFFTEEKIQLVEVCINGQWTT